MSLNGQPWNADIESFDDQVQLTEARWYGSARSASPTMLEPRGISNGNLTSSAVYNTYWLAHVQGK